MDFTNAGWEAATTALALTKYSKTYKLFITLHNSYDTEAQNEDLLRIGVRSERCPGYNNELTILSRAIPLVQRPVFTVSEQFALDITSDTFQVKVMAKHLQKLLESDFLGINNGPFESLHVDEHILRDAMRGSFNSLREWKSANRKRALEALDNVTPTKETPVWGDLKKLKRNEDACWFVMAGRDDPRQKGYDVAAAAIRLFLKESRDARFFFFPIPGDEDLPGLTFLKNLAADFPESVLVFPFRWKEGFFATLRGAAYGIMPSLYEPFGGANEFYLNGTVGIGRATGGLIQQIVPLWAVSSFSHNAQKLAQRWHSQSSAPTGLLFREKNNIKSIVDDWEGINKAKYDISSSSNDRVLQRKQYTTFNEIVHELYLCIKDGVRIYQQENPDLYYKMVRDGIIFIQNSFSWERAAQEYTRNVIEG